MTKKYTHVKPIAQDDKYGCWSASMAWWTKAMTTIPNWTDDEIMVEYDHLRGENGGLRFPEGFRQMLQDPKWGLAVDVGTSTYAALELVKTGLEKGPVMFGFWHRRVCGHHAVVVHDYTSSMQTGSQITYMDPNGGEHVTTHPPFVIAPGNTLIVGYLK